MLDTIDNRLIHVLSLLALTLVFVILLVNDGRSEQEAILDTSSYQVNLEEISTRIEDTSITKRDSNELTRTTNLQPVVQESQACNQEVQSSTSKYIGRVTKSWIIIGLCTESYIPVAKIWYHQLTELGYNNHYIVALDEETFNHFTDLDYRIHKASSYIDNTKNHQQIVRSIWPIRFKTIYNYLKSGQNILVSDVDSIWVKYQDLNSLPTQFDTFHGKGGTFPPKAHSAWGFVLCGCLGAYHSNENTIKLYKNLLDKCKDDCDDQRSLNYWFMARKVQWKTPPGMNNLIGYTKAMPNNQVGAISSLVFSFQEVQRGKAAKAYNCRDKENLPWIVSPNASKNVKSKLDKFREMVPSGCLLESTVDLLRSFKGK